MLKKLSTTCGPATGMLIELRTINTGNTQNSTLSKPPVTTVIAATNSASIRFTSQVIEFTSENGSRSIHR